MKKTKIYHRSRYGGGGKVTWLIVDENGFVFSSQGNEHLSLDGTIAYEVQVDMKRLEVGGALFMIFYKTTGEDTRERVHGGDIGDEIVKIEVILEE